MLEGRSRQRAGAVWRQGLWLILRISSWDPDESEAPSLSRTKTNGDKPGSAVTWRLVTKRARDLCLGREPQFKKHKGKHCGAEEESVIRLT